MENISVLYKYAGDNFAAPNAFLLCVPEGKDVYLLDILNVWRESNVLDINYSFQACTRKSTIALDSPVSVVPVINGMISLILTPSVEPPISSVANSLSIIKNSRMAIATADSPKNPSLVTRPIPVSIDKNSLHYSAKEKPSPIYSENKHRRTTSLDTKQNNSNNENFSVDNTLISDETVSAIKSVAEEAGRSLLSFATHSLKTAQHAAASFSSQIQVGHHKVTILKELAEGGFGKVYIVRDVSTKTDYAMKQLLCQCREQVEDATNELKALQRFRNHRYLINLIDHGSSVSKQHNNCREVLFLFPFYSRGTAWGVIERSLQEEPWPFSESWILQIIHDTAHALQAMHDAGLAHRDMKPHNILLNDEKQAVLMDLGSVTTARVEVRSRSDAMKLEDTAASKTSAPYRAPELTQVPLSTVVDGRVDIWGLGCTMYCLAFSRSPFESPVEGVLRLAILNGRYSIPVGNRMRDVIYSDGFMKLIAKMLCTEHETRPSASDVIQEVRKLMGKK